MRKNGLLSTVIPGLNKIVEEKKSKFSIDYPQAGEKVQRGHYSIRVSGCEGECQAAIDDGDWQNCRNADGFSWYDWSAEQSGAHRISVRVRSGKKWLKIERACIVV